MAQKVRRNTRMDKKEGQGGGGLSLGNPGEERRLAATLSKIDREKRKRETAMSWNQRSFFMKQVFDQDNELRFVKAAQRPKYLNCIPPPPREGDNSWMKDEYVFSFKPKSAKSPETKDFVRRKREEGPLAESPKALGVDDVASADQPPQDKNGESQPEGQEVVAAARENEEAERQQKEQEKRDLANKGVFGARREQMKMPLLMPGAWKQKTEPELKPEQIVEEKPNDSKVTHEAEAEESKDTREDADPLNQSQSSSNGTPEAVKPKTRFPVLKVRALGLFAMTFKKSAPVSPLQSQPQLQSQSTNELKLSPIPNPEKEASIVTASFPPQTAPTMTVKSPLSAAQAASELERPGSVSLPNSPVIDRKPQIVRQQSDHSILVKSTERPKTDRPKRAVHTNESGHNRSRRGSRRDGTAKSNHERSKRHSESSVKSIKSASAAMSKNKRDGTAKTNLSSSVPDGLGRDSNHIWGAICENENQDKEHKDSTHGGVDGKDEEDVEYHVIRRIVRTLPAHLMLKTSRREVEAGGDVALLRQKMMDLARADTTRRASLDPRFKKLENSLCNSPP